MTLVLVWQCYNFEIRKKKLNFETVNPVLDSIAVLGLESIEGCASNQGNVMKLNERQIRRLSEKIGQDAATPAGATVLHLDIESTIGIHLGVNTIKRLVGVLPSDGYPRRSTLNIIASYLGYPDWKLLQEDTEFRGSGFDERNPFIEMAALESGTLVEICWKPDRRIVIRHDGGGRYEVTESENCKLRPGFLLTLSQLAIGYPFVALAEFQGKSLGCYRAAEGAGITRFNILSDFEE